MIQANGHLLISQIEIINIKGIAYLVYEAGMFNDITGDNEVGKSSFQDAIAWALRPKLTSTPEMLRRGAKLGSVKITYSDHNFMIATIDDQGKVDREWSNKKKSGLGAYIQGLTNIFALNPEMFRLADKKGKVQILCEALPLNMDWGVFEGIIGYKVPKSDNPAEAIDAAYEKIFKERTQHNTLAEDRERTYRELTRSLPAEDPENPEEFIKTLEIQQREITTDRDEKKEQAEHKKNARLEELREIKNNAIKEANRIFDEAVVVTNNYFNTDLGEIQAKYEETIQPITAKLGERREYLRNFDTIKSNRALAEEKRIDAEGYRKSSKEFTEQLKQLDLLKKTIFTSFPIPGVTILNGEVHLDNEEGKPIPFDSCSDSQQKAFMLNLAKFVAMETELPLVRMDAMEAVNPDKLESFKDAAIKTGVQHWISRFVKDAPLTINAYN